MKKFFRCLGNLIYYGKWTDCGHVWVPSLSGFDIRECEKCGAWE